MRGLFLLAGVLTILCLIGIKASVLDVCGDDVTCQRAIEAP